MTQSIFNVLKTGTVTYKPTVGDDRVIDAIVKREQPEQNPGGHSHGPVTVISVINDATAGISSDEIDLKGDRIEYPVRIGQATQIRTIRKIAHHDEGLLRLEVW